MRLWAKVISYLLYRRRVDDLGHSAESNFIEHLNQQASFFLVFAFLAPFSWLLYIPVDRQLFPDLPLLYFRLGFPVISTLVFLLSYFARNLQHVKIYLLSILVFYMNLATGLIVAFTGFDPAYLGGYLFLLMVQVSLPLPILINFLVFFSGAAVFLGLLYFWGVPENNPHFVYSVRDYLNVLFVGSFLLYLADKIRYLAWRNDQNNTRLSNEMWQLLSDKMKAEKTASDAEKKSKYKSEFMQQLIDNMPTPVYYKDIYSLYMGYNRAFATGVIGEKNSLIGLSDYDFFSAGEADELAQKDTELFSQGGVQSFETSLKIHDGSSKNFIVFKGVFKSPDGQTGGLVGVMLDISQLKEMEAELIRARQKAEAASRAKSEFLANMSHELRTPMNAILGYSELMQNEVSQSARGREYLSVISTSGKALLAIINDILDLSKIEAGKMEINAQPLYCRSFFSSFAEIFAYKTKEKGIDFSVSLAENLPAILSLDEVRVRQILFNLAGNAVKFTDRGFVRIEVEVENLQAESCTLLIAVRDSGIGIFPENIDKIFESFQQQPGQAARFGGTGLGLSITRRLVQMMRGELAVQSMPGQGSVFTVKLPLVPVLAPSLSEQSQQMPEPLSLQFAGEIVLVADDIDYNRALVKGFLEPYNLRVVEAENGREALQKIKEYRPQVLLLDMAMPVVDGYQVIEQLKAEQLQLPIIAFTASALNIEEARLRQICDGYLQKPVDKSTLLAEISRFIEPRRQITLAAEAGLERQTDQAALLELARQFQATASRLHKLPVINQVIEFASDLQQEAQKRQLGEIEEYAGKLLQAARSYNHRSMKKMLADLPQLWQKYIKSDIAAEKNG